MALQRGITINIHLGDLIGKRPPAPTPVEKPSECDALLLRLMNKNESDGEAMMKLSADILAYIDRELKAGNKKAVKKFLSEENRAMLTEDMKDLIKEKLSAHNL